MSHPKILSAGTTKSAGNYPPIAITGKPSYVTPVYYSTVIGVQSRPTSTVTNGVYLAVRRVRQEEVLEGDYGGKTIRPMSVITVILESTNLILAMPRFCGLQLLVTTVVTIFITLSRADLNPLETPVSRLLGLTSHTVIE